MSACLVTGGAGFIGSHLVEALRNQGHHVRILDNFSTGDVDKLAEVIGSVELIAGDVANPMVVQGAVQGVEVVYHLAPPVFNERGDTGAAYEDVGTQQVLQRAHAAGVRRVVFASTAHVVERQNGNAKCSPYAAAKLASEQSCKTFARDAGLETVCLRYFNVIGPRQPVDSPDWQGIVPILRAALTDQRPLIHGTGNEPLDVMYIDDAVHAALVAAESPRVSGRVFDIGSGHATTMKEIIAVVNAILGLNMQPIYASNGSRGQDLPAHADSARAEIELGFSPSVDLEQGLRRCIAYYATRPEELLAQALHSPGSSFDAGETLHG